MWFEEPHSFLHKVKHLQVFKQRCLLLAAAQSRASLSKGRKTPLHQKTKHTKRQKPPLSAPCAAASRLSQQASVVKAARE